MDRRTVLFLGFVASAVITMLLFTFYLRILNFMQGDLMTKVVLSWGIVAGAYLSLWVLTRIAAEQYIKRYLPLIWSVGMLVSIVLDMLLRMELLLALLYLGIFFLLAATLFGAAVMISRTLVYLGMRSPRVLWNTTSTSRTATMPSVTISVTLERTRSNSVPGRMMVMRTGML